MVNSSSYFKAVVSYHRNVCPDCQNSKSNLYVGAGTKGEVWTIRWWNGQLFSEQKGNQNWLACWLKGKVSQLYWPLMYFCLCGILSFRSNFRPWFAETLMLVSSCFPVLWDLVKFSLSLLTSIYQFELDTVSVSTFLLLDYQQLLPPLLSIVVCV